MNHDLVASSVIWTSEYLGKVAFVWENSLGCETGAQGERFVKKIAKVRYLILLNLVVQTISDSNELWKETGVVSLVNDLDICVLVMHRTIRGFSDKVSKDISP
jgi:hypothetical protein